MGFEVVGHFSSSWFSPYTFICLYKKNLLVSFSMTVKNKQKTQKPSLDAQWAQQT